MRYALTLLVLAIALPLSAAIDHFEVTAASPQIADVPFLVTVTAKDFMNNTVNDSSTQVSMSSSSSHVKFDADGDGKFNDDNATLLNGSFSISTVDGFVETITITATSGAITGTSSVIAVVPGPAAASKSSITAVPTSIVANGTSTSLITVRVRDVNNHPITTGGESVTMFATHGGLTPVTDNNDGTYSATLTSDTTVATAIVTATVNGQTMSTSATVTFTPGPAVAFLVAAPDNGFSGAPFDVTVTALDANGNTATGYRGTVHFTSNDNAATLPADYIFIAGDNGVHTFQATMNTPGTRSITATDTVTASITGSDSLSVITPFGAPQTLAATASSSSQVELTWAGVTGATAYEIERSSLNSGFAFLAFSPVASYSDGGLSPNTTYLYRVKAIDGDRGLESAFSAVDAATTTIFTDATLTGVVVKAVHFTQLRTAIDAIRAAAGLGAASYSRPIAVGDTILAGDVTEMRTALNAARSQIGLAAVTYSDASITTGVTSVKAVHLGDLREGVQ